MLVITHFHHFDGSCDGLDQRFICILSVGLLKNTSYHPRLTSVFFFGINGVMRHIHLCIFAFAFMLISTSSFAVEICHVSRFGKPTDRSFSSRAACEQHKYDGLRPNCSSRKKTFCVCEKPQLTPSDNFGKTGMDWSHGAENKNTDSSGSAEPPANRGQAGQLACHTYTCGGTANSPVYCPAHQPFLNHCDCQCYSSRNDFDCGSYTACQYQQSH